MRWSVEYALSFSIVNTPKLLVRTKKIQAAGVQEQGELGMLFNEFFLLQTNYPLGFT